MAIQPAQSGERYRLSADQVETIVAEAARLYFESRRLRVNAFVEKHFSLAGSLALHRKALGWDVLRAPANIALAVPYIGTKLAAGVSSWLGAKRLSGFLGSRRGIWYSFFPVAASPGLIAGATGTVMAAGAVMAAFSGIIADPLQRRLGLHNRRLLRLIDGLEAQFNGDGDAGFVVRDHYVARLLTL